MGISLGQGLAAFAGGALDRAKEIDKAVADRIKTLKASKPDELLKSRYKKEYEKFDKEQATLAQVTSAGGPNTEAGQMALMGITSIDDYRKQLAADPTLYAAMRDAPTAPKYTPTDYNLNGPNTIQRLWASATGDYKTADKGEIEATAGTTTSFKRGEGIADTPEGKERRDTWRRNIPADDTEKEYQFKWRTHQGYVADAVEKYKDNPNSDEAKRTFKALDAAGKTLIYGKDSKDSQTDWQRKLNLHMLDTPKQTDFENEGSFNSAMTKWKHGYNILKLGSSYDDTTKSGKEQVVSVFDAAGKQVKVIKTGNDDDMFGGIPGWKQFGGAEQKSDTAKRPTLQKTYNASGDEVTIEYTGDSTTNFEGRPGWVQVGGAKAPKGASVAEKKWAPIQVIVDAITEGRSVTQAQLDAAEFITRMTKDAVPLEYHKVLDTWNASTVQVRDYSDMPIKLGGISVPATTTNINAAAAEYNMTPQEYKKQLYKQVKKTQSKSK
jgi:hypothetical protein